MRVKSIAVVGLLLVAGVARAQPVEVSAALGFGKPAGDEGDDFSLDVGGAVSVGARMHPNFGMHLRLAFDRLGVDEPAFSDASMWMGRLLLEPAAHVVRGRVDFSLGPTFGLFYQSGELDGPGPADGEGFSRGITAGVRVGLSFLIQQLALGPYFAYDRLFPTKSCFTVGTAAEICNDDPDDFGFWQLGVAATF